MRDGKLKPAWEQTALLAYLLAEPNRNSEVRKEPFTPDWFNPYAAHRPSTPKRKKPEAMVPITALRDVFIDNKWPQEIIPIDPPRHVSRQPTEGEKVQPGTDAGTK